ncbi:MAG: T9SS type A sorting domain-containing protein [Bacteroidota bacterium]
MKHFYTLFLWLVFALCMPSLLLSQRYLGGFGGSGIGSSNSLALSVDGKYTIIGRPYGTWNGINSGSVQVYKFTLIYYSRKGDRIKGDSSEHLFGFAVDMAKNGNRIAVGSPINNYSGQMLVDSGYVNIYEWNQGDWQLMGLPIRARKLGDQFGYSVAMDKYGETLVVGIPADIPGGSETGSFAIYELQQGEWTQVGSDITDSQPGTHFGRVVDISQNGQRIAVGAPFHEVLPGKVTGIVQVYEKGPNGWAPLGAPIEGLQDGNEFGSSLALSSTGKRLVVGAPEGGGDGQTRVFEWNGIKWVQIGSTVSPPTGRFRSGEDVDISGDGERIIIGTPQSYNFLPSLSDGYVQVRDLIHGDWVAVGEPIISSDQRGTAVSISSEGDRFALTGPGIRNGSLSVYSLNNGIAQVGGKVVDDPDKDCFPNSAKTGIPDIPVVFQDGPRQFLAISQADGIFEALVDSGDYLIYPILDRLPYRIACPLSIQQKIDQHRWIPTPFFNIQTNQLCPYLEVDLTTPGIRRCFGGTYFISYCNRGTSSAPNSYVEVKLDSNLTYLSSSLPLTTQNGDTLRFNLGTVNAGDCGSFSIQVNDRCLADLGEIYCSQAHIYPDTMCAPNTAHIVVESSCNGNTLSYDITNRQLAMATPLPYYIMDKDIVVDSGSIKLNQFESTTISHLTYGTDKKYQLVISPETPYYYTASGLKGCSENATTTEIAYLPETPQPFEDEDCTPNRGSYDPNDKTGYPEGVGPDHNIPPNTPLSYRIRFQNTGTDTAIFINIYDTLAITLDPLSFQIGASSHPMTYKFVRPTEDGRQVLRFTFDPIFLPDSGTNQLASNGFVDFHIRMKAGLFPNTLIENSAAIYFDYNEPIITNTYYHTVELPQFAVKNEVVHSGPVSTVFPNPTKSSVFLDLTTYSRPLDWVLANLHGQEIAREHVSVGRIISIQLPELAGIYFLQLKREGSTLETHKIVKE